MIKVTDKVKDPKLQKADDFYHRCEKCNKPITQGIVDYSRSAFGGQELCIDCQKKERERTYPKKMAKFINEQVDKGKK